MGVFDTWIPYNDTNSTDRGLSAKIDSVTGLTSILDNIYFVDGRYLTGRDIISAGVPDANGDYQKYYMVRKKQSWDSVSVYIAKSEIAFRNDSATRMGIRRQFQRYGSRCNGIDTCSSPENCHYSDCSNYPYFSDQSGSYMTNWYKSWIDLPPGNAANNDGYKEFTSYSTPDSNNLAMMEYMDANRTFTNTYGRYELDDRGWLVYKPLLPASEGGFYSSLDTIRIIRLYDSTRTYDSVLTIQYVIAKSDLQEYLNDTAKTNPNNELFHGPFFLSPKNGYNLAFGYRAEDASQVPAVIFDIPYASYYCMNNVIRADAAEYNGGEWNFDYEESYAGSSILTNSFSEGKMGKYRPVGFYSYYTDQVIKGVKLELEPDNRVYNQAGIIDDDIKLFGWQALTRLKGYDISWIPADNITMYSSGGNVTESKNALGIYSTKKYCFNNTVPYLVAGNAQYNAVGFQSFEDKDLCPETALPGISSEYAHTGRYSERFYDFYLDNPPGFFPVLEIKNTMRMEGILDYIVKYWVKVDYYDSEKDPDVPLADPCDIRLSNGTDEYHPVYHRKVAQTGEWSLYEAYFEYVAYPEINNNLSLLLQTLHSPGYEESFPPGFQLHAIYLDDIRIQPAESEMTAYVYDEATLKPAAVLDDQNFAMIFQYDALGNPVRSLMETQNGIKTVYDVSVNSPMIARDAPPPLPSIKENDRDGGSGLNQKRYDFSMPSRNPVREGTAGTHPAIRQKMDVLNIQASPDRINIEVLKGLPVDSLLMPDGIPLPSAEQIRNEVKKMDSVGISDSPDEISRKIKRKAKAFKDSTGTDIGNIPELKKGMNITDSLDIEEVLPDSAGAKAGDYLKDKANSKAGSEMKKERNIRIRK